MGKRGRPRKNTNQQGSTEKQITETMVEEITDPATLITTALRNMGFSSADLDLGEEIRAAIANSPMLKKGGEVLATEKAVLGNSEVGLNLDETVMVKLLEKEVEIEKEEEVEVRNPNPEKMEQLPIEEETGSRKEFGVKSSWADKVEAEREGKVAWAEVAKGGTGIIQDQKLEYIPPDPKGVIITDEEQKEGEQLWKFAVVGYVLGQRPGFKSMTRFARAAWKPTAPQIYSIGEGVFLFNFFSEADMEAAMSRRWSFGKSPLILQKWKPEMRLENLKPEKAAIWVRLSCLSLCHWSNRILSKLASSVGRPIQSDLATAVRDRINFARVLVEVDVNAELPDRVPLTTSAGTSWIVVTYEWYPKQCPNCQNWGHKEEFCTGRREGVKKPEEGRTKEVTILPPNPPAKLIWKQKEPVNHIVREEETVQKEQEKGKSTGNTSQLTTSQSEVKQMEGGTQQHERTDQQYDQPATTSREGGVVRAVHNEVINPPPLC